MQATISKKDLQALSSTAIRFVSRVSVLPALTYFKLEVSSNSLRIHATDLEKGIVLKAPVANAEDGAICIDAQKLTDFVSRFTGESVKLNLKGDVLNVICGNSNINLRGLDAVEFPPVIPMDFDPKKLKDINIDELQSVASRVSFACAQDSKSREARPHFGSVFFNGKVGEGTDGYIMALNTFTGMEGALVAFESVVEAGKVFRYCDSIKGYFENGKAIFSADFVIMVCNTFDHVYPDLNVVLPRDYSITAKVVKSALLSAIGQAMIVASDERVSKKIALSFDEVLGICNVSTHDEFSGDVSIDVSSELKGDPITVFINGGYLKAAVERCALETVEIRMNDWNKPIEIREGTDWRCVIMPMGKGWGGNG